MLDKEISLNLSPSTREACRKAIKHAARPRGWRWSEYAMTKSTAEQATLAMEREKPVTLFAASCLLGELARLASDHGRYVGAFKELHEALLADEDYRQFDRRDKAVRKAVRRSAELRRRADKIDVAVHRTLKGGAA